MRKFPEIIIIKINDSVTRQPVPNLAVFITLFATRKNDFHFLPEFSDEKGEITIASEWLADEIKKVSNLFIMDYSATLESCYRRFEISTLSGEDVQRAVKAQYLFKSVLNINQDYIYRLSRVDNSSYLPTSKLVNINGNTRIDVDLSVSKIHPN
jgi:hypothetical protein